MAEFNSSYESSLAVYPKLSLRSFCQVAEVKYSRLRDYRRSVKYKQQKELAKAQKIEQIRQTAELHPTYGYRLVYQELGCEIGREFTRKTLKSLGLTPSQESKAQRFRCCACVSLASREACPTGCNPTQLG
jgi:hypothetical protein